MAGKKSDSSVRAIAAKLSAQLGRVVTQKTVRVWQGKGYPLDDPEALEKRLRNQERASKRIADESAPEDSADVAPAPATHLDIEAELKTLQRDLIAAPDYETARTIRTKIAGVRDVLKSLREQDYYVTKESQIREGMQTGQTIKSLVLKIPTELPQMLVGLSYADSVEKCENYAYAILTTLHETGEIASG